MSKTNEQKLLAKGWKRGKDGFTHPKYRQGATTLSGAKSFQEVLDAKETSISWMKSRYKKAISEFSGIRFQTSIDWVINNTSDSDPL